MAELTNLESKLGEVVGLAMAAQDATQKVIVAPQPHSPTPRPAQKPPSSSFSCSSQRPHDRQGHADEVERERHEQHGPEQDHVQS